MNFKDERHALFCGWVLGSLMKQDPPDYTVVPVADTGGDYLPHIRFIHNYDPARSFTLDVPEPPEEWHL